jgi:glutamyl-tRNA synthetase
MTDGPDTSRPRLRFAPSPTGPLHLGGARTALYNWAAARAMGGTFLLRIEDTDRARSTKESLDIILEALRWLGIDWDEGPDVGGPHAPYFQTERLDIYARYAKQLVDAGHAYECFATPEEVEEGRKRLEAEGKRPMYDRRHRDLDDAERAALRKERGPGSLRFRMPTDGTVFALHDLAAGEVKVNLDELDDWVMVRPDGMPTYNFACVVDDLEMGITHVVRGQEHQMNGIKQAVLFERLGAAAPKYAHIPLILAKSGKKLSKRDADTNILDYRDKGYLPEAMFNYIALLGWGFSGDRDLFTRDEMVEVFKIESIGRGGAKFDDEKLAWMSGDYIRRLTPQQLVERARPWLEKTLPVEAFDENRLPLLENAVACFQERIELLSQLPEKVAFVYEEVLDLDDDARKKLLKQPEAVEWLNAYADRLAALDGFPFSFPALRADLDRVVSLPTTPESAAEDTKGLGLGPQALEQDARAFVEEHGIKFGHFVHPVRAAITGTTKGPGLFDCIYLVGQEKAVARLRAAADEAQGHHQDAADGAGS